MIRIIYGIHTIQSILERNPQRLLDIYLSQSHKNRRLHKLIQQLDKKGLVIKMASRQWLDKKTDGAVHQGIIARVHELQFQEKDLLSLLAQQATPLLLILDSVIDPHNLGACLRCADAAGVHAVIVPRKRTAPLNATAQKVASGAAETVPLIRVTNLARTLRLLQIHKLWIVGTDDKNVDHDLYKSKLTGPLALIMGGENKGMRSLTRKYCDELISIPMAGTVFSLNVSVATGICLFEAVRQRNKK
ncbi:23S rRNA (guanosine-2'-O-)-methyltransferase RlmB [secondary endosymbiont of Trabutina mannipara]|uniref:23S rRNA (guanosine-2'-O-)-methyltransferase RlmB n=1 Tax=secondary endosymbiont of Trabutina mannipara TaxID=1835721 RepID=A0A1C3L4D7_9ENTR|nr:23S rRNA (guanosine(2251)-2'-O)-methyltransferase RlmB [secondary endosymbiont of Trabutina mannipara]SBT82079.1 23S rRNA (guanosine-2'-O-)-methyltransferase RlmB [secondary endosymbiont of Trabutina mannipara]